MQIFDYTVTTNKPPTHIIRTQQNYDDTYLWGGDKKVCIISQHLTKKNINESGKIINNTEAQYFSGRSYIRVMYHLLRPEAETGQYIFK